MNTRMQEWNVLIKISQEKGESELGISCGPHPHCFGETRKVHSHSLTATQRGKKNSKVLPEAEISFRCASGRLDGVK